MKIELTEEQCDKLFQMIDHYYPNYSCIIDGDYSPDEDKHYYGHDWLYFYNLDQSKNFRIHWFEFVVLHLSKKIGATDLPIGSTLIDLLYLRFLDSK